MRTRPGAKRKQRYSEAQQVQRLRENEGQGRSGRGQVAGAAIILAYSEVRQGGTKTEIEGSKRVSRAHKRGEHQPDVTAHTEVLRWGCI